jgi:lyso-ornithine lipid O-acyltransferase
MASDLLRIIDFKIVVKNNSSSDLQQILIGNHVSFLDIIVLLAVHPEAVFLSKKEVASWPIIGAGAKRMGTLFVDRSCAHSRAQAKMQIKNHFSNSTLKALHLVGFPFGTTCLTESKPWKKGLFEIAEQTGVPVQPFRISYEPARECAYIDNDNLISTFIRLFKTPNKKIIFEWGTSQQISNLQTQMLALQNWARPQEIKYEEKISSRSSHSLRFQ